VEPGTLSDIWLPILNNRGPYLAFFVGIYIACELGLYPSVRRKHQFLMGLPVALLVVSAQMLGATPSYQETVVKFLGFCGTIMFFGTVSPSLFASIRDRVEREQKQSKSAQ
jgi:hypothetical protein